MTRTTAKPAPRANQPEAAASDVPAGFRRLNWNEVVSRGDFVVNDCRGFVLWEGPAGFQADSFLTPIYRENKKRSTTTKKPK